jgi:CubicO group peptidase (beta-lactamase class C family)
LSLPGARAETWAEKTRNQIAAHFAANQANRAHVGAIVGVIKDGQTYVWSFGEKVLGSGQAPDADTFFEIGSITKTFTGTLLGLEVARGRVTLDQKVKTLWPELDETSVGEITLEELATHTAGLPRLPSNMPFTQADNPYVDYGADLLLDFLKTYKVEAGPHAYDYSNLGVGLLGYLLSEKLNKLNFPLYLKREIFSPLKLESSFTVLGPADLKRLAFGHTDFLEQTANWDFDVLAGAGAIKSTMNDMLAYAKAQLDPSNDELGRGIRLAQQSRKDAGHGVTMGLGWHLALLQGSTVLSHTGGTGGYRSNIVMDPAKKLALVELSNTERTPICLLAPVLDLPCRVPQWSEASTAETAALTGEYFASTLQMRARVFLKKDYFAIELEGQQPQRLWRVSEGKYLIHEGKVGINFERDGSRLTLKQSNKTFLFDRTH